MGRRCPPGLGLALTSSAGLVDRPVLVGVFRTAMTRSLRRTTSRTWQVRARSRFGPCRRATQTARGCARAAGCAPDEAAGTGATSVSNAAASWERAELWLRTNITRDVGCGGHASSGAVGTSRRWFRRRSPSERSRVSRPAAYTVLR